ncbi:hypothetical protein ACIPIN_08145 [Pseudomonas sp. NPDC087697]|uniref:hypothetical protein n=1 Tax=Pseudomonas sp. NPDC087697 TaxID=3364447 RepID=UPI00382A87D6
MGSEVARIRERSKSRKLIEDLYEDSQRVYVVHYSCESFYENSTGGSTRVTSIAIRNLKTAQTRSWSIHKAAELQGCLTQIPENFPALELLMLDGYFEFLRLNSGSYFTHWNMRDENYGFFALEHRHRTLGGTPFELLDDKKVDLARVLVSVYGRQYAPHEAKISEINGISDKDALTGAQEAEAFEAGEYLKLHQSTLRKLDMFCNIFERMHEKTLKTNASWIDANGIHPNYLIEKIKSHWVISAFILLATLGGALANWWKTVVTFWGAA